MERPLTTRNSIVLVPFPFDDFSATKVRPALCLTDSIGEFDHVVIAFISSKVPNELEETEVLIAKDSVEFFDTGLLVSSVLKLHRIVTVPRALIQRRLGFVGDNLEKEIAKKLKSMFHLE